MSQDSWNPQQYEKFKKERDLPFYDLMDLIHPARFETAVDLGCGTGELTKVFHERFHLKTTVGIDNSSNMLQKAPRASGLTFSLGNLETFSQLNQDLIISNAAIQWCNDHPSILKRIHASLKSGGQMCLQMPANHDYPTHTLAETMAREFSLPVSLNSVLSLQEYAKFLYSIGFQEQVVQMKIYGHVLESREAVVEWVKGTTLTRFKTLTDYDSFLMKYTERLFQVLPDERPFFYPFKRIFLWARK